MLLELHMLQNFAPSNLNRDDTGSPKDCQFGGYTRARISSQCLKRAIRTDFKAHPQVIPSEHLAVRTKRIVDAIADRLEQRGRPREQAMQVAKALIDSTGIGLDGEKTKYLIFVSQNDIATAVATSEQYWDGLLADKVSDEVKKAVKKAMTGALDASRAVDLALFGRMVADRPESNVEAASQVAHAISTHEVSTMFDFYTAVDDLKPQDTAGADMLGTVEFNSACFYRYANIDVTALAKSLDSELAQRTIWAFIHASVNAIPTGKQNSMAAHNKPSFVMAIVREDSACNLANAFLKPARPGREHDLCQASMRQLDEHWGKVSGMYGTQGIRWIGIATMESEALKNLSTYQVAIGSDSSQIAALANQAVAAAFGSPATR
jgi:CRISPR system Cascade subunit CasC